MTPFSPLASLPDLPGLGTSASNAASSAASAVSTVAQKTLFGGLTLSQVIIILVGLLLIGAGLFTMHGTREIIVNAGKTAAKAAA